MGTVTGIPDGDGTRRLLLLRHAKSSWDDPDLADHDRPLAPRGRRATADLRRHLAEVGAAPDLVLCSTARRAVDTWEAVAPGCPAGTPFELVPELYGASADALVRRLRLLPDGVRGALVIGHNPCLGDLAHALAGTGDPGLRHHLETEFPTGALATLTFTGAWASLDRGTARLAAYVVPRQLGADAG
jgi:phosphohistidine phosphatase